MNGGAGSAFRLERDGAVAVLTFDLPGEKLNKLSRRVVEELSGHLAAIAGDPSVKALVVRSAKPEIFVAGADLDEFLQISSEEEATAAAAAGQKVFDTLAALPIPTIAAVNGACMGGGCELALACDRRLLADLDKPIIGLPEVRLGIFPAWGGTHRLPRLVGLSAALDVILAGKTLVPKKALAIGLADELVPPQLLDARAVALAKELAATGKPRREAGRGKGLLASLIDGTAPGRAVAFSMARKGLAAKARGFPAPVAALDSVERGLREGIAAGQREDSVAVARLAAGPVAANLLDIYFWSENAKTGKDETLDVRQVGVLGAGVMGGGIAWLASDRGFRRKKRDAPVIVRLRDLAAAPLASGIAHAKSLWEKQVRSRRFPRRELAYRVATIQPTLDWSGFGLCDVTVEAVVERLDVKQSVLGEWETASRKDAVFASNTSTLPITQISAKAGNPSRVVGMHFFNPVDKMPLVEVIPGEKTAPEVTAKIVALALSWDKTPVVVADRPGFLVNRILAPYLNEALLLVEEGVDPERVDRIAKEFGMPMGPLVLIDEVGIDTGAKAGHVLEEAFGHRMKTSRGFAALAESGRSGKKNGRGIYRYVGGRRKGVDAEAVALLRRAGGRPGGTGETVGGAAIGADEVLDRLILPMVKEAAICLDEKVVGSPEELDLAMVFGIGFPPYRGGICKYVDARSAADCVASLTRLAAKHGIRFEPPAPLVAMAGSGAKYHPPRAVRKKNP